MLQLARPEDQEAVNRLAAQVHSMYTTWRPDLYEMPRVLYDDEVFARVRQNRQLYVATMDGTVVGYTLLSKRPISGPGLVKRTVMSVESFCVEESCRNQGVGTRMMEDIRALARAFGCTDLQLSVYPQNDEAVGFYQKCGFAIRCIEMQRKV